jgi:hypothetical protein
VEWKIEYLEKDGFVNASASGETSLEEHMQFTAEAIDCARGTHKIFIDFMKMAPDLSVLEVDELPEILKQAGVSPEHKMAVLFDYSSPLKQNFVFFGNVVFLKSLQIKPFADKKSALQWLSANPAEKK